MPKERILPRTYRLACVTSFLVVQLLNQPSLAFNITPVQPGADNLLAGTAVYTVGTDQKAAFLSPFGIEPLIRGGTVEFLNTLNSDFPTWTFNAAATDLNGSFNIINNYACGFNTSCGIELGVTNTNGVGSFIDVDYVPGVDDPPIGTDLHWIQRVANNHHLSLGHGSTDDKVDVFSGATDPYYDTAGFAGIGSNVGLPLRPFVFVDRPYRSDELSNHDWVAELYLVEETAPNTATIYNGMRWGWGNTDATASSTSQTSFTATFEEPLPDGATHTGIGTNNITWGVPFSTTDVSSALSVTPQPYGSPVIGEPFVAGLITYTNGTIVDGTGLTSVVLEQRNVINAPDLGVSNTRVDDNRTITMNNTPNTSDPIASADFVSIPPAPGIGTGIFPNIGNNFHVIEGQSSTATLLGRIIEADVEDIIKPDADPLRPPFPDDPRGMNPLQQQFVFEWLGYGEVVGGDGFVTTGVQIVPEVFCDFNTDLSCDVKDINLMFAEGNLVTGVPVDAENQFDLNRDLYIDQRDISKWLGEAATVNGYRSPYRSGDTDDLGNKSPTERTVDITDFQNFLTGFTGSCVGWECGNFNGDDVVDITDFSINFLPSFAATGGGTYDESVPEPNAVLLLGMGSLMLSYLSRRKVGSP